MAVTYTHNLQNGVSQRDADDLMENFTDLKTVLDGAVQNTGNETIAGAKTFSGTIITSAHHQLAEISAPTEVANAILLYAKDDGGDTELYAKDDSGNEMQVTRDGLLFQGVKIFTGQDATMEQTDTLTISHDSDTSYKRKVRFVKEVTGSDTNNSDLDFDAADEANYTQGDFKQTAAYFQVDTANTSGHFEDSGNTPVTVGSGNTCPYIQAGIRFKLDGDATWYEVTAVTGDGEANDEIAFWKQDGTAATKATGTYALTYVYGTEFDSGSIGLNSVIGSATETWADTLNANASNDYAGRSIRQLIDAATISTPGDQIRITLEAGTGNNTVVDNASIVPRDGATADGTATPTEILFSGVSGCTVTASGTVTSDWLNFDFADADHLVVIDYSDDVQNPRYITSGGPGFYYKVATNSYDQQSGAGFSWQASSTITVQKVEVRSIEYPIDNIYVTTTEAIDSTYWEDINSATVTETLGGETHYYAVSFDDGTTYGIYDDEVGDVGWRPIARDNSGTWEYNSNVTAGANDVTWTSATINSAEGALSQAMGVSQNQMTSIETGYIDDAAWNNTDGAMSGFVGGGTTTSVTFGIGQITATATVTPTLSLITVNYLARTYWEPITDDDSDWNIELNDASTELEKLGTGTTNVRGRVTITV